MGFAFASVCVVALLTDVTSFELVLGSLDSIQPTVALQAQLSELFSRTSTIVCQRIDRCA
jgi:hypothetical protein